MKSSPLPSFYLLFISFLLFSCDIGSEDFVIIETSSDFDYYAIEIHNDQLYIAGGEVWQQSDLTTSSDGLNWQTMYFTNRAIFDLHSDQNLLYAVGTSGYIYTGQSDLNRREVPTNSLFRAITTTSTGIIAIAGKDFNKGWIYPINNEYQILNEYIYNNELSDVKCNDENCIAVGYGIILYSDDEGLTWTQASQTGDFYNAIAYNIEGTAYTVGYNGSIIHSNNGGKSWTSYKNAHSPLANNKPFRKIKFFGQSGYIVGDNGTIWKSDDSGLSWRDISLRSDLDLFDLEIFRGKLYLASEAGRIISTDL